MSQVAKAGIENILLISLVTSGDNGSNDAAGAVVNSERHQWAARLGMTTSDFLSRNDAYSFFDPLGDMLKPSYSGTNVNDLVFLIGL